SHADDYGMAPLVDSVKVKLNNCGFSPSTIDRTCNWEAPLSGLSDSLADIDLFEFQLSLSIDNGSTEELLRMINNPFVGPWQLGFVLSEGNPYLSDTVLLALIARFPDVSQNYFEHSILVNSPLSDNVWKHLELIFDFIPDALVDDFIEAQQGVSARDLLWARINSLTKQAAQYYNHLFTVDSADLRYPSLYLGALASQAYWILLSEALPDFDTLDYFSPLVLKTKKEIDERNFWTNYEQSMLYAMTMPLKYGNILARNMLRIDGSGSFQEQWPEFGGAILRNTAMQFPSKEFNGKSKIDEIFPNPGHHLFTIKDCTACHWELYDLSGKKLEVGLSNFYGQIEIEANLKGVYLIKTANGNVYKVTVLP
ncbi:MAG: hypothetical protein ACI959_000912, partial [Limisphaerales bacterium]